MKKIHRRFAVAPMMKWTDKHCRFFHRLLTKNALLYTEMIYAGAIINGSHKNLLSYNQKEHPLALQIGGSNISDLQHAASIGADYGYDEINLNVGCPSDKVQSACFGAAMMKEPDHVAACLQAMKKTVKNKKLTVKCRIGIDDQEPQKELPNFLDKVIAAGVDAIIIHARKALLDGLSPKMNRTVPELDHKLVLEMKKKFPRVEIVINGGIENLEMVNDFLKDGMDGVMVGRAAYTRPSEILFPADKKVFDEENEDQSIKDLLIEFCDYIEIELKKGSKLGNMTKHLLGVFNGKPGAKKFRQALSENSYKRGAGPEVLIRAMDLVKIS